MDIKNVITVFSSRKNCQGGSFEITVGGCGELGLYFNEKQFNKSTKNCIFGLILVENKFI
jgi:hypothetical protein